MKIDHISLAVNFESSCGDGLREGESLFIIHFGLCISLQISALATQLQVWL